MVFSDPKHVWNYEQVEELTVRRVTVRTASGRKPLTVAHITDPHYKACTPKDLENPVLRSTNEYRWAFDPKITVPNTRRALDYADSVGFDQLVVTGDCIDYLSEGSLRMFREEIWDRYRDPDGSVTRVMASLGNHEPLRQMQGAVPDPTDYASRYEILQANWEHPIFYFSKVLDERVMLIQLDDASLCDTPDAGFLPCEVEPFRNDLALARQKGYAVLLFYHIPLSSGDPADAAVRSTGVDDRYAAVCDLYHCAVNPDSRGASGEIYRMITHNADLIRGCFCGHNHNDFYTGILAQKPDGTPAVIPQYALNGTPYQKGHLMLISVL